MKTNTELMIYKHIVKEYGHLDFEDIKNINDYRDCVMMEHGIRDLENWNKEQYTINEMMRRHYMFRWFFDEYNDWWDWYVEEYEKEPEGVKKDYDINEELERTN
jgi:hypothetical protein